jgi:hypothetical protein
LPLATFPPIRPIAVSLRLGDLVNHMKRMRWSTVKRVKFLAELAATADVTVAAAAAQCRREEAYMLRAEDADFAASWDHAEAIGRNTVQGEAAAGSAEPVEDGDIGGAGLVVNTHGRIITLRKHSDALLLARLKAQRPDKTVSDRAKPVSREEFVRSPEFSNMLVSALHQAELEGKREWAKKNPSDTAASRDNAAQPTEDGDTVETGAK